MKRPKAIFGVPSDDDDEEDEEEEEGVRQTMGRMTAFG